MNDNIFTKLLNEACEIWYGKPWKDCSPEQKLESAEEMMKMYHDVFYKHLYGVEPNDQS